MFRSLKEKNILKNIVWIYLVGCAHLEIIVIQLNV